MLHAAALPENYFTVWHNLFERGQLKAGEIGADPWRRERHRHDGDPARQGVRRQGVHHRAQCREGRGGDASSARQAVLYKDNDWAAEVKKLSGGVDVVLDMVAGDYLPKNLQLLKQDGRCVVIAAAGRREGRRSTPPS